MAIVSRASLGVQEMEDDFASDFCNDDPHSSLNFMDPHDLVGNSCQATTVADVGHGGSDLFRSGL